MLKLFEDLIRYNANDRGSRVGDCVKRSLSLAFDLPYNEVQKELNQITRDVNGSGYKKYDYHNPPIYILNLLVNVVRDLKKLILLNHLINSLRHTQMALI